MLATAFIARQLKFLEKPLYLYPGGTIAPLLHECRNAGVELVVAKVEQGAGYMAIAEALHSFGPAFVAVTSGPGATNLISCLADAWYDSIPLVAFTGQVGTADLSRSATLRQRGFQEVPILRVAEAITKGCFRPASPEDMAGMIKEAIHLACEGRPGPVLLDLPMNIQMLAVAPEQVDAFVPASIPHPPAGELSTEALIQAEEVLRMLRRAERPVLLVGGGCRGKGSLVRALVERFSLPVLSSIRGLGVLPTDHPLNAGWIGHTGYPWANKALLEADMVLALGSRLDIRQTGNEIAHFTRKQLIHVDIDEVELVAGRLPATMRIHADCGVFLEHLLTAQGAAMPDWSEWRTLLAKFKATMRLGDHGRLAGVAPDELLRAVDARTRNCRSAIVTGVGSHQQWAMRYFSFAEPGKQLYTSAGHGTMGFALPVALGIKRIDPERLVIAVDGDGSFQMNLQELALAKELGLNIKILLLNNNRLGIVSQFQQITFADDPTTGDFSTPDFCAIAAAYGVAAWAMESFDTDVVQQWLDEKGPALLHVKIQHDAPVSPMLLGGQALDAMWYAEGNQP